MHSSNYFQIPVCILHPQMTPNPSFTVKLTEENCTKNLLLHIRLSYRWA